MKPLKFRGSPQAIVDNIVNHASREFGEAYIQMIVECLEYASEENLSVTLTDITIDIRCEVGTEYVSALKFIATKYGFSSKLFEEKESKFKCVLFLRAEGKIMTAKSTQQVTTTATPTENNMTQTPQSPEVLVTPAPVAPVANTVPPTAMVSPINESIEITLQRLLASCGNMETLSNMTTAAAQQATAAASEAKAAAGEAKAAAATIAAAAAKATTMESDFAKLRAEFDAQKLAAVKPTTNVTPEEGFFDTTTGKVVGWSGAALVVGGIAYGVYGYLTGGSSTSAE